MGPGSLHDVQVLWILHWVWTQLLQRGTARKGTRIVSFMCFVCVGVGGVYWSACIYVRVWSVVCVFVWCTYFMCLCGAHTSCVYGECKCVCVVHILHVCMENASVCVLRVTCASNINVT